MKFNNEVNNVIFDQSKIFLLDKASIDQLKNIALAHPLKRARICLHQSEQSIVHEMIIVAHRNTLIKPHKHPKNKPESYHVLLGNLIVKIFDNDGKVIERFYLSSEKHPKMYKIQGDVWHQPIPDSEWVVYHEVATGPFDKERDVIYSKWEKK